MSDNNQNKGKPDDKGNRNGNNNNNSDNTSEGDQSNGKADPKRAKGFPPKNPKPPKPNKGKNGRNGRNNHNQNKNTHTSDEEVTTSINKDLPEYLRVDGGTKRFRVMGNNTTAINGQLLSRTSIEHIKFSPLGEFNSLIRFYTTQMMVEVRTRLVSANLDYALKGPLIPVTMAMVDEYLEMTCSYIVTYEFLSRLYSLSRYDVVGAEPELVAYAQKIIEPMRGMGARLSGMREHIRKFHLPGNLLKLICEDTFGIYLVDPTSEMPRIEIIGIEIPTNYDTYTFCPAVNPFASEDYNRPVTNEVVPLDNSDSSTYVGYNPEEVMRVPMLDAKDVRKASNLISNMDSWTSVPGGTFEEISKILALVVPGWQLKNYSFIFDSIPTMSTATKTWIRNFGIITDGVADKAPYPTEFYSGDTPESTAQFSKGSEIEYVSSSSEKLPLYYLMLLWYSTTNGTGYVAYPGMFLRIGTRLREDDTLSMSNPRYILPTNGVPKQLIGLDGQSTLQRYFNFVPEYRRIYRNTLVTDDVQRLPSPQLEEPCYKFIKFVFNFDDFMSSPLFRSSYLLKD